MRVKHMRGLALVLLIIQLFSFVLPVCAVESLLDSRFNLGYTGSRGYQILNLTYNNPAVESSFSKLADRALTLKNSNYSYTEAISILTETKAIVGKVTSSDYQWYEKILKQNIANSGSMSYQFSYDSFIMRNVLYAMFVKKASYTEMLKAVQLIYEAAMIQTQNGAFRSDALDVLIDVKILASYSTDKEISDMLYYVSNFATGVHGRYDGNTPISSANVSQKYEAYVKEQYDKLHSGQEIEHNSQQHTSEYAPGGHESGGEIQVPSIGGSGLPSLDNQSSGQGNSGTLMSDSFMNDLDDLFGGGTVGQYTLYYTFNKRATNPTYHKTKVTTKQFVTYENIVTAIITASRNSDLVYVEDSDAMLVVYDGLCFVLDQSDVLYDAEHVASLFDNMKNFGLYLGVEKELTSNN